MRGENKIYNSGMSSDRWPYAWPEDETKRSKSRNRVLSRKNANIRTSSQGGRSHNRGPSNLHCKGNGAAPLESSWVGGGRAVPTVRGASRY